jgi:acyl-CoA thioesterase FadM
MPRIKLKEAEFYTFEFKRTISDNDLNYAGHLGNDRTLSIIQEARVAMLAELGVEELDLGDGKTGIIIGDLVINFLSEVFSGDVLVVEISTGDLKLNSMRLFYRIRRTGDTKPIALVETGIIAFDYETRTPTDWPKDFLKKIKA